MSEDEKISSLEDRKKEIEELRRELASYGMMATSQAKLSDLKKIAERMRLVYADKPRCYKFNFSNIDARCRICDLKESCGKVNKKHISSNELFTIQCDVCGSGKLSIELIDENTKHVYDYGCTSDNCLNTLLTQTAWHPGDNKKIEQKDKILNNIETKAKLKDINIKMNHRRNDQELDRLIINVLKREGAVKTQPLINKYIKGNLNRTVERIRILVYNGTILHDRIRGYYLPGS